MNKIKALEVGFLSFETNSFSAYPVILILEISLKPKQ